MDTVQRFRLGSVVDPDDSDANTAAIGRISIPYLKPSGVTSLRFRKTPWMESQAKYWSPKGSHADLFNSGVLIESHETIYVCEGEFDTIIANQLGLPTVGFPGVSSWQKRYSSIFQGFRHVVVLADNDDNGQGAGFGETIREDVPGAYVKLMPKGFDLNSLYLEGGLQAVEDCLHMTLT